MSAPPPSTDRGVDSGEQLRAKIGIAIVRVVVPLWVLAGAVAKLIERSPALLPSTMIRGAGDFGIDLGLLLRYAIGVELVAVGAMVLLPRAARLVAIAITGLFCLVLIAEMAIGSGNCGCFGSVTVPPGVTFAIDCALLLGALLLAPRRTESTVPWRRVAAVGAWVVAAFALALLVPPRARVAAPTLAELGLRDDAAPAATTDPAPAALPDGEEPGEVPAGAGDPGRVEGGDSPEDTPSSPDRAAGDAAPTPAPTATPRPTAPPARRTVQPAPEFYVPQYDEWIGTRWDELELASFMSEWPDGWRSGTRVIVFYRLDCPHCHDLLEMRFVPPLPYPTTLIAIPERDGFPTSNVFPNPCTTCELLELPSGTDWFVQTPAVVVLRDGVVTCAAEVDPEAPECLEW